MDGEVEVSTSQVITTSGEVGGLKSVIAKPCFFCVLVDSDTEMVRLFQRT